MTAMESAFWDRVVAEGHRVPSDRSLADLTAELTAMLGDPDPHRRDSIAYEVLATWISEGVYDQLLEGLGDGMTAGLMVGIGEVGTDTVFRRSFSALILAACVGSPAGSCASRTCGGSSPARAGPTRSPTAPTCSGRWPGPRRWAGWS
jgi:hypothetical protein